MADAILKERKEWAKQDAGEHAVHDVCTSSMLLACPAADYYRLTVSSAATPISTLPGTFHMQRLLYRSEPPTMMLAGWRT